MSFAHQPCSYLCGEGELTVFEGGIDASDGCRGAHRVLCYVRDGAARADRDIVRCSNGCAVGEGQGA